ncbi:ABC-type sugar transport system, permease component [Anaerobranca californiensis DSM 14826]|jgi:multiple sugar transport system permease protein|uniref:ABC-type sugar transport system, permease component n=1 Tax=Anaerobranca californiensis DSM 14826 TaxID=1120989 RepID=A0A1M6QMF5_9FIRM|nr:ABC transporter permease subunit [Anaerobranca californiensis]SHK21217.1 ABC-type sugar transport system, permease component [Anaerobranca californiensis DSM 14826]
MNLTTPSSKVPTIPPINLKLSTEGKKIYLVDDSVLLYSISDVGKKIKEGIVVVASPFIQRIQDLIEISQDEGVKKKAQRALAFIEKHKGHGETGFTLKKNTWIFVDIDLPYEGRDTIFKVFQAFSNTVKESEVIITTSDVKVQIKADREKLPILRLLIKQPLFKRYDLKETISAYTFLAPFLIIFFTFLAFPFFYSMILSFYEWDMVNPAKFVGLANYKRALFDDPHFFWGIRQTLLFVIIGMPFGITVSLILALLLNNKLKFKEVYRTAYFLPNVLDMLVVAIIWVFIYNPQYGVLKTVLESIGITYFSETGILGNHLTVIPAIVLMTTLKGAGGGMIFFLAALQNIPKDLYEAAEIDGASTFRQFRSITLPMIKPIMLFMVVTGFIGSFGMFTEIYAMTGGGPTIQRGAARAQGEVVFYGQPGTEIPEGTRVVKPPAFDGDDTYVYITQRTVTIPQGSNQVTARVRAQHTGEYYNTDPYTITQMPNPPPGVEKVENISPISGGKNGVTRNFTRVIGYHMMSMAFLSESPQFGYAAAMSFLILLITLVITFINFKFFGSGVEY